MSIKISIGDAEGQLDWELLEEFGTAQRASAPEPQLDNASGWPRPVDDDDDDLQPWAW